MTTDATKAEGPVGSHFRIEWTTESQVKLVNVMPFDPAKNPTVEYPGMPVSNKQRPPKDELRATLTVKRNGSAYLFEKGFKPLERKDLRGGFVKHVYSFIFAPDELVTDTDTYVFSIEITGKKSETRNLPDKTVTVTRAETLTDKRQDMVDLVRRWMPTSLTGTRKVPDTAVDNKDLLNYAGWSTKGVKTWSMPETFDGTPPEKIVDERWTQDGYKFTVPSGGEAMVSYLKKRYNDEVAAPRRQRATPEQKKAHPGSVMNIPIVTSCNDVMGTMMKFWGTAIQINVNTMVHPNPDYYVKAVDAYQTPPDHRDGEPIAPSPIGKRPKPGDIIFLAQPNNRNEFAHVCILLATSSELWTTGDGGAGALPNQEAVIGDKTIELDHHVPPIPTFVSPTDGKRKLLHGWVELENVPNSNYDAKGKRTGAKPMGGG